MTKAKKTKSDIIKMHMKARMTGKVPPLFKDINKLQHLKHKEEVDLKYLRHYDHKLEELGEWTKEKLDAKDRYKHHEPIYEKSMKQVRKQVHLVKDQVTTKEEHFFSAVYDDWIRNDVLLDEAKGIQSIELPGIEPQFF